MKDPIHIISLGAGVQSSTMALMAAHGELEPMPEAAIFADTQHEPKSVYSWLDYLEGQLPFPIMRVSRGSLFEQSLKIHRSKHSTRYIKHSIPSYIQNQDGTIGISQRHCSNDFKIEVIRQQIQKIRSRRKVVQWIGISWDEFIRAKPSRVKYITNVFPLIERMMRREDCLKWMKQHDYPAPPRSACSFCPYHSPEEWLRLETDEPEAFDEAVRYEQKLQSAAKSIDEFKGTPYLHRSLVPLGSIDFKNMVKEQNEFFGSQFSNECEGMCGV